MTQTSFFSLRGAVFIMLVVTASFLCTPGVPAAANDSEGAIEQIMSPEEFKAAGLDKLSSKELKNLNAWLRGDREKVLKKAAAREARIQKELIVSRVDGVFNGASTGTIIPLEDGTSWKLANAGEHYSGHADHPGVAVFKSIFGWKMRIGGIAEFYVLPVKTH
jgi:hypothetical protein